MKTNHQRNFKDTKGPRYDYYHGGGSLRITEGGKAIQAYGGGHGDACCGKRGMRRDKAGAKKFVRSRTRFHNKAHLKKMVSSLG